MPWEVGLGRPQTVEPPATPEVTTFGPGDVVSYDDGVRRFRCKVVMMWGLGKADDMAWIIYPCWPHTALVTTKRLTFVRRGRRRRGGPGLPASGHPHRDGISADEATDRSVR